MKKTTEPLRMSYETYAYLKSLIEQQMIKLENDFRTACYFIPPQSLKGIRLGTPSGVDKAHNIFSKEHIKLKKMKDELHTAAASTYKDHPNPKMREFWGLV
jgi:hypothetical protein